MSRRRSTLLTLGALGVLGGWVIYTSLAQVRYECEVEVTFRGRSETRRGASGSREDSIRSAVSSACGTLASGMAESIACDNTPPGRVDCREL